MVDVLVYFVILLLVLPGLVLVVLGLGFLFSWAVYCGSFCCFDFMICCDLLCEFVGLGGLGLRVFWACRIEFAAGFSVCGWAWVGCL